MEAIPIALTSSKEGWGKNYFFWPSKIEEVLIRIHTSNGLVGYGESHVEPWYYGNTLGVDLSLLKHYGEILEGGDPENLIGLHQKMTTQVGRGGPMSQSARSAVDMALYDLAAKAWDVPVYKLLGGKLRDLFDLKGELYLTTPEDMARSAVDYVKRGYGGLKVKIALEIETRGWSLATAKIEMEKLESVLNSVPDSIPVDADANQGWGLADRVIALLKGRFEKYGNLAIEQPVSYWDLDGLARIARELTIPIVLDETITGTSALMQAIRHDAGDRIVIKLARVGGLLEASKLIHIAESAGMGVSIDGLYTRLGEAAITHLAAIVKNPHPLAAECHYWFKEDPMKGGVVIEDGKARLPQSPGLGVEFVDDVIESIRVKAPEQ